MLAPRGELLQGLVKPKNKEWAHMVDVNQELTNFKELVPNPAREVSGLVALTGMYSNSRLVAV